LVQAIGLYQITDALIADQERPKVYTLPAGPPPNRRLTALLPTVSPAAAETEATGQQIPKPLASRPKPSAIIFPIPGSIHEIVLA